MDQHNVHPAAIVVFCLLFVFVSGVGFAAMRWRRADLGHLNEWGLAGRRFGTCVTWFLIGGDIYRAYTFIAVPAAMFATGSAGFLRLCLHHAGVPRPFMFGPRMCRVQTARIHHGDRLRPGRFDSSSLALTVAFTGILATMPYIGLQLIGLKTVIASMGISGDWPIIIAFVVLAAYTYQSGLRAPALTAIVKDLAIYITVLVAIVVQGDDVLRVPCDPRQPRGRARAHAADAPAGPARGRRRDGAGGLHEHRRTGARVGADTGLS